MMFGSIMDFINVILFFLFSLLQIYNFCEFANPTGEEGFFFFENIGEVAVKSILLLNAPFKYLSLPPGPIE